MIRCEHLTRVFGEFHAVRDLTFEIPRGSICAFAGPNGSGKSTTMRMLTTLLKPTRGRAWIGGYEVTAQPQAVRQLIGYLPETFNLYEDLTVERYLYFFAKAYSLDDETGRTRVIDYLERLGLCSKKTEKVASLSRGMRQRLGVAKSFLHDPLVVLLDEPASGLDPVARGNLAEFLKYQQWLGKTILISSHVLKELADFCDYMLLIGKGELVEFGPLYGERGIMSRYSNEERHQRRYRLRVLKDAPRLEELLKEKDQIGALERKDVSLSFDLSGDETAAAALLKEIVDRGIPVCSFHAESLDLERVYRKASGGRAEE